MRGRSYQFIRSSEAYRRQTLRIEKGADTGEEGEKDQVGQVKTILTPVVDLLWSLHDLFYLRPWQ